MTKDLRTGWLAKLKIGDEVVGVNVIGKKSSFIVMVMGISSNGDIRVTSQGRRFFYTFSHKGELRYKGMFLVSYLKQMNTASLYEAVDPKCRDMVEFFNEMNISTISSCQGHNNLQNNAFYVIFDVCVTDKDIDNFLSMFDKHTIHSPFIGTFKKWMRKIDGIITSNWIYSIDYGKYKMNQEFALEDYKTMKNKRDEIDGEFNNMPKPYNLI